MSDRINHAPTVIGPDTHIKGEIAFESSACVLGRVEGRITSKGELSIGEGASCKTSIDAGRVIVDGTVEGDIVARDRLELNAGAQILGDIVAAKLIVAEGASFVGNCRVGEAAIKAVKEQGGGGIPIESGRQRKATPQPVGDIETTLAGFEAKLAEFSRGKTAAGA